MRGFIAEAPAEWRYDLALSSLRKGEEPTVFDLSFSLGASVKHWGLEYRFDSPVEVSVSASRVGDQIVADISVASESSVPCSRCLERALLVINGNLRYLFSLRPLEREKTQPENKNTFSDGDEEAIIVKNFDETVNLGPLVWEVLITSLPPAPICSEACEGLCPVCGANLNTDRCSCKSDNRDPRFDVLREAAENGGV